MTTLRACAQCREPQPSASGRACDRVRQGKGRTNCSPNRSIRALRGEHLAGQRGRCVAPLFA